MGVLVRLLWPRMRKRSGRLGGKGAPGSARAAVLNFLAALPPSELRPLLLLFLHPLDGVLPAPTAARPTPGGVAKFIAVSEEGGGLFDEPWWAARLGAGDEGWWLAALDARALHGLPARQRIGLLNAAADLLRHLVSGVAFEVKQESEYQCCVLVLSLRCLISIKVIFGIVGVACVLSGMFI